MPRSDKAASAPGGRGNQPLGEAYLTEAGNSRTELAKRLKDVWEHLTKLSQDDRPKGLEGTTKALGSSRILDHTDKDVRLFTACSLAEVLRIYAPEAPFSSPVLLQGFALVTAQLRGLSTVTGKQAQVAAAQGHKPVPVLYLLHSLATVKSCIILSELVQQDLPRAEEELVDFFDCLLRAVREDHPPELREQVLEVLAACLAELEVVPQALLDTVLLCLLPEHKAESPASYQLTQLFVARCFAELNPPITAFINQVLTGKGCGASEVEEEHVYPLIYELHKVNPNFMLYIFPNIATQLAAEDTAVRARAVALLGRLFAASHADYGHDYPRIFREFLGRFKDKEAAIRAQAVGIGAVIMQRKPKLAEQIVPLLAERLKDPEWEIRAKTAKETCQVALHFIELVSGDLLRDVGGRLADRKPQVRLEVVRGLVTLYAAYVSRTWSEAERAREALPPDLEEKLAWIPGTVLMGYSLQDHDLRLCILQAFDEVLLPKTAECQARTTGLLFIWQRLGAEEQRALRVVLQDRATVQARVGEYLAARTSWRVDMEDEAREIRLQEAGEALLDAVPPMDKRAASSSLPLKLNETKDQQAPKLLQTMVDPRQPMPHLLKARDELAAKLGSKTSLGDYVRMLARRASSCFATQETLADLIQAARELLEAGAEDEDEEEEGALDAAVDLMELLVENFPVLLPKALPELLELCWAAGKEDGVQVQVLRLIATRAKAASKAVAMAVGKGDGRLTSMGPKGEAEMLTKFRQDMLKLCLKTGSAKATRLAVSALCQLVPDGGDAVYTRLLKDLTSTKSLSSENPRLEAVLRALAVLAERHPVTFEAHADEVRGFALRKVLRHHALGEEGKEDSDDSDLGVGALPHLVGKTSKKKKKAASRGRGHHRELSEECLRACAAIKLLVAHAVGLRAGGVANGEDSILLRQPKVEKKGEGKGKGKKGKKSKAGDDSDLDDDDSEEEEEDKAEQSSLHLGEVSALVEVSKDELEASAGEVLDLLYEILEADGQTPNGAELSREDKARLRLVSAGGVLKMMRNQYVQHRLLDTPRWRALGWVMLDPEETVAGAFTRKLAKAVRGSKVHLKFLALLSLAALEEDADARKEARQAVTRAVQNLRRGYEDYMAGQEEEPSEEAKRKVTTSMMPEYLLPYLLHLLTHFPDFPTSLHDAGRWRPLHRCLAFLLEPLMVTLGPEADNLSFLLLMTDTILTGYKDASTEGEEGGEDEEVATMRLHQVTMACREYLRSKIKTQENLQAYPGKIYLPLQLYSPRKGGPLIKQRAKQGKQGGRGAPGSAVKKERGAESDAEGGREGRKEEDFEDGLDGPNWGLSPIAMEILTTAAGALARRSGGGGGGGGGKKGGNVAKKKAAPAAKRGGKGKGGAKKAGGKKRGRKVDSESEEEASESEPEPMEEEDEENRPPVQAPVSRKRKSVAGSDGTKVAGKRKSLGGSGVNGGKRKDSSVFDYDEMDENNNGGGDEEGMDSEEEDLMKEVEEKARNARKSLEAQKASRAERALKRGVASEEGEEEEEREVVAPLTASRGKGSNKPAAAKTTRKGGKQVVEAAAAEEEDEEEVEPTPAAPKRRKKRAVG